MQRPGDLGGSPEARSSGRGPGNGRHSLRDLLSGRPGALALSILAAGGLVAVLSGALDSAVIDRGPLLWSSVAVAGGLAVVGCATRPRCWWLRRAPLVALGAAALAAAGWLWLRSSGLTGDSSYPAVFVPIAWLALFVLGAGLDGLGRSTPGVATARALSGPAALLAVFLWINSYYGYWPTAGALLGAPYPGQVSAARISTELAGYRSNPVAPPATGPRRRHPPAATHP
ncbi:MAG: hypothetical protein M0T80_03935, partial [Actinomycetota bacterium]|nr:hypothetical protein [Actinomycetota bacterium]